MDWSRVADTLSAAVMPYTDKAGTIKNVTQSFQRSHAVAPGAELLVGYKGSIAFHRTFGCRSIVPELTALEKDMVFDIGSLSQPIVTTTLIMQLVKKGQVGLLHRLSRIFQTFGSHGKEQITIKHLLTHTSGFPPSMPFYQLISRADNEAHAGILSNRGAIEMVCNEIFRSKLSTTVGGAVSYSDIGAILLGQVIEALEAGKQLDKIASKNIFAPLKMHSSGFIDLDRVKRRGYEVATQKIVPTAKCPLRGEIICGEVYESNAWAVGGVAGHAGLFSTARDIHLYAREMINCWHGRGSLVNQELLRQFWTKDDTVADNFWSYGWEKPRADHLNCGKYFSESSAGFSSQTGCSLWIDPEKEVEVILLTNRLHPSADNNKIREFRPVIHDQVMETLLGG